MGHWYRRQPGAFLNALSPKSLPRPTTEPMTGQFQEASNQRQLTSRQFHRPVDATQLPPTSGPARERLARRPSMPPPRPIELIILVRITAFLDREAGEQHLVPGPQ